jgi:hypothetical protein
MKCEHEGCYEAATIHSECRYLCAKHTPSPMMMGGGMPGAQGPSPLDVAQTRITQLEARLAAAQELLFRPCLRSISTPWQPPGLSNLYTKENQ